MIVPLRGNLVPGMRQVKGEIPFRDKNTTPIFRNERMMVVEYLPVMFYFLAGLAGAYDQGNVLFLNPLQARLSLLERVI
jgi:hypothetical protein